MARQVKGRVYVLVEFEESDSDPGVAGDGRAKVPHKIEYEKRFTAGTVDGTELDRIWSSKTPLTTSPSDLDLVGTSLTSKLGGQAVSFADLGIICVTNSGAVDGGHVQIGAGSNPVAGPWLAAGDGAKVYPEGIFLWVAPHGVQPAAGTADILRLVASAGSIDGEAMLAGRSA